MHKYYNPEKTCALHQVEIMNRGKKQNEAIEQYIMNYKIYF